MIVAWITRDCSLGYTRVGLHWVTGFHLDWTACVLRGLNGGPWQAIGGGGSQAVDGHTRCNRRPWAGAEQERSFASAASLRGLASQTDPKDSPGQVSRPRERTVAARAAVSWL